MVGCRGLPPGILYVLGAAVCGTKEQWLTCSGQKPGRIRVPYSQILLVEETADMYDYTTTTGSRVPGASNCYSNAIAKTPCGVKLTATDLLLTHKTQRAPSKKPNIKSCIKQVCTLENRNPKESHTVESAAAHPCFRSQNSSPAIPFCVRLASASFCQTTSPI